MIRGKTPTEENKFMRLHRVTEKHYEAIRWLISGRSAHRGTRAALRVCFRAGHRDAL